MNMRKWFERRFWDFRSGHGTYLAYALGLINFIVINYHLLISNVPFLQGVFTNLWRFAVMFIATYFPVATLVGWLVYRKRQFKTDAEISAMENPFRFRAVVPSRETILDLPFTKLATMMSLRIWEKFGVLTPDVKEQYRYYLELIDKMMIGQSIEKEPETKEYRVLLKLIDKLTKEELGNC